MLKSGATEEGEHAWYRAQDIEELPGGVVKLHYAKREAEADFTLYEWDVLILHPAQGAIAIQRDDYED
ncbi:hypothetical protein [Glycomyces sp. NPDC021274]|uniref:hypothetical protein n=1 Tax=Glycomyces sp. NPDC021274 TaxID=3155120 RepID=UPI00340B847A